MPPNTLTYTSKLTNKRAVNKAKQKLFKKIRTNQLCKNNSDPSCFFLTTTSFLYSFIRNLKMICLQFSFPTPLSPFYPNQ